MMMAINHWSTTEDHDKVHQGAQAADELQEVGLQQGAERVVKIGKDLDETPKNKLVRFLQEHQDCFAWSPNDMDKILTSFAQHTLNVDRKAKPVKQKRRLLSTKRQTAIKKEVMKLLHNGVIREV